MNPPPTDDDLPVLGGVWLGPRPSPATPANQSPQPAPRRRTWPLLAGALLLVGIGGVAGFLSGSRPLGPVLGVGSSLVLCGVAYLTFPRPPKPTLPSPERQPAASSPPVPPPIPVIDTPASPPEPDNPKLPQLEEVLLNLCRADTRLFERLVEHERSRHPDLSRQELVQLAIDHYRRDHN